MIRLIIVAGVILTGGCAAETDPPEVAYIRAEVQRTARSNGFTVLDAGDVDCPTQRPCSVTFHIKSSEGERMTLTATVDRHLNISHQLKR